MSEQGRIEEWTNGSLEDERFSPVTAYVHGSGQGQWTVVVPELEIDREGTHTADSVDNSNNYQMQAEAVRKGLNILHHQDVDEVEIVTNSEPVRDAMRSRNHSLPSELFRKIRRVRGEFDRVEIKVETGENPANSVR
jgi:ribonuclease HI